MTSVPERQLVTFALFTYNQEGFVLQALESALGQDYSPLELIISDDCSSDSTFDLIQARLETYSGNHVIVLNRNMQNLGVAGHINRVMELASGEWVVGAAGDDISLPNRVSETMRYRDVAESCIYSVCSSAEIIDDTCAVIGRRQIKERPRAQEVLGSGKRWITGCSHAWDRRLFDFFGPLRPDVIAEDKVLGFRALLLGGRIGYIDRDLVRYRQHDQSISSASFVFRRSHMLLASALSHEADFEKLLCAAADTAYLDVDDLRYQIEKLLKRARAYVRIADSGIIAGLWGWFRNLGVVEPRVATILLAAKVAGRRRNQRLPVGPKAG